MNLGLEDKVALITGGSRGIGFHTAAAFANEGCRIGICARSEQELVDAEAKLRPMSKYVHSVQADVCVPADAARVLEECASELGGLDILVNNVGGAIGAPKLTESTSEDWERTYAINLFQTVHMTRLSVPHFRKRGGGSIVNISSISGWEPQLSGSGQYGSSKAALIFLTERLALEFARECIRINTVSPGSIIWPDGGWDKFRLKNPEAFDAYVRNGFPMGRLGFPEEVADVIVFLASPRANWINGRNIPVDGLEQPVPAERFW